MSLKVKQISIVEHDGRKCDIQSDPEDAKGGFHVVQNKLGRNTESEK